MAGVTWMLHLRRAWGGRGQQGVRDLPPAAEAKTVFGAMSANASCSGEERRLVIGQETADSGVGHKIPGVSSLRFLQPSDLD